MAREKHLTSVYIGNFKRFVDFRVENLGQFNLVVGDNNTGKTSFLEALVVDEEMTNKGNVSKLKDLVSIRKAKNEEGISDEKLMKSYKNQSKKQEFLYLGFAYSHYNSLVVLDREGVNEPLLKEYYRRIYYNSNKQKSYISFAVFDHDYLLSYDIGKINFNLRINGKDYENFFELNGFDHVKLKGFSKYLNFVPFGVGYNADLEQVYDSNIEQSRKRIKQLIEQLQLFIPNVVDIRLRQGEITIYESDKDLGMPLYTYGEGAVKFFRILCYLSVAQGKRLMIDEIDTGIHHTKFIRFWKAIMQAATTYDVQLFATTHNEECLEYFIKALEAEEMVEQRELARVVSLKARAENKVRAKVYDFNALQRAEELNREIRGGGL